MSKITKKEIIEALESMKLTEINDLVKTIEEHFQVTASAPVMMQSTSQSDADEGPKEVNVILVNPGGTKIAVIKEVAAITGKPLMEAKGLVEKENSIIKEKIKLEEANEIKEKLVALGAVVEIK